MTSSRSSTDSPVLPHLADIMALPKKRSIDDAHADASGDNSRHSQAPPDPHCNPTTNTTTNTTTNATTTGGKKTKNVKKNMPTQNSLPALVITEPSNRDILCGRGGLVNKHSANIVYRLVVEKNKALYRQVPKIHRMLVSQSIVLSMIQEGYIFLGHHPEGWTPIDERKAVSKTSQALREKPLNELDNDEDDEDEEDQDDEDDEQNDENDDTLSHSDRVVAQVVAHAAQEIMDAAV